MWKGKTSNKQENEEESLSSLLCASSYPNWHYDFKCLEWSQPAAKFPHWQWPAKLMTFSQTSDPRKLHNGEKTVTFRSGASPCCFPTTVGSFWRVLLPHLKQQLCDNFQKKKKLKRLLLASRRLPAFRKRKNEVDNEEKRSWLPFVRRKNPKWIAISQKGKKLNWLPTETLC